METNNEIILRGLFYNKVTTANEKIRMIKDAFQLSLKDLAKEDISVMCISNIVNGKRGITPFSGECLVKNINSLLKVNIEIDWLLEEPSKQTDRLLETSLNNYEEGKISIDILEEIIEKNTSYIGTDLLLNGYECLIKGYMQINQLNYSKVLAYCEKGIEISFKISNYSKEVLFKHFKASAELDQGNALDAFRIYESIKERASDKELHFKIHYNIIMCLRQLKEFDKMVNEIKTLEKTHDISEKHKKVLRRMEANSLACLGKHEEAIELHEKLLIEHINNDEVEDMCIQCYNIADNYFEKGEIQLAKKYISLRLEQKNDVHIVKHLLFAATIYSDLIYVQKAKEKLVKGDLNSLYDIYNKELEVCIKNNDIEMLKVCLENCIERHIKIQKQSALYYFMNDNFEKESIKTYLESLEKNNCF